MKRHTLFVLLIILLGMGLRLYRLGDKSLGLDEASSVFFADKLVPRVAKIMTSPSNAIGWRMWQQMAREWNKYESANPPFYYLSLHLWMKVGRSEFIIRLYSALAGVLSILITYWLARALFSGNVGLLSALLLAISPLHIDYSQQARMFALITLLTLISVYCMLRFLKTGAWGWGAVYVLCTALNLYTHYITVFVLAVHNVAALLWLWKRPGGIKRLLGWAVTQFCVLALFVPWVIFLLRHIGNVGAGYKTASYRTLPLELPARLFAVFSLGQYGGDLPLWVIVAGLGGFLIFVVWGVFAPEANHQVKGKYRGRTNQVSLCLIYLFFAALGALVLMEARPHSTRLALWGLPAYYILVARGIERIRTTWRIKSGIVAALAILSLVAATINVYHKESEDWRGVADYVLSRSQPGDVVIPHAYYIYKPFKYYVADRQLSIDTGLSQISDVRDAPAVIQAAIQEHSRIWLVLAVTEYVDPNGEVKRYLDEHCRTIYTANFAKIDSILYEKCQ